MPNLWLITHADHLRRTLYETLYTQRHLCFRTPAAFEPSRPVYRAAFNLRPLAIWLDTP
ncbi:hypothetical protein JCM17846_11620 [Iodidimonas nitroreducens]|uniref:Uncharacterized protein n=1 Tax=Iodidimonas nitroreducens TaxID=1236968 RepID=A0A5A7N7W7_9PROT|nr:hypothetical protein [Iodidimonas nitroreducens]GER03480.1 hypothetical protein JCM17846_11620 [Iodidimonas nitroreducens]